MDLEIVTAAGAKKEKIDVRKQVEQLSFKLDGKPTSISLDKISVKMVKVEPIVGAGRP